MIYNRNHNNELGFSFYLCKPNREEIDSLNSIENIVVKKSLNQLHELSFSIPATINKNHKIVDNPLIKKIRQKYLVKEIHEGKTSYYLVSKRSKKYNNKTKNMDFTLYGLMKQIGDEINYEFEEDGKTLRELSDMSLQNTNWKTGYVDGDVAYKQRSYEASQENKLQTILNLAEKFEVVPIPNDEKREIDFYSPKRLMTNRGITFEKNHYLESFNIDYGDEIITKLYVYGDEGLTISRTTSTGAEFIVDYSYYLYPFEQDENGNIINHSYYMSDSLCISWIAYQKKLKANEGKVETLTKKIEELEEQYFDVAFELSEQQIEVRKVQDHLDILKSTQAPESEIEAERRILAREQAKFDEIDSRVKLVETQLERTTKEKVTLVKTLSIESNLTKEQIIELTEFTTRKNVTNSTIVDDEDLLEFAKETMKKINQPPINLTLSLEDFKSRISKDTIVNNVQLGDEVLIYSRQLDVNVKTQILNITYNIDNNNVQVTTSNALEVNQPQDLYNKILFGATGTSTTVEMDKHKWEEGSEAKDAVSKILNGVWDATKNAIVGGVNQSVVINERGLTITSSEDPMKKLVAQNGVLALTKDGGNSWRTAITPDGVYAEELVGRIIMGNKLHIEDEKGIITIVGSKQTIYDRQKNEKVILGEYEKNKYGIKINDGAIEMHTKGKGQVGITIDGNGIVAKDSSGQVQFSLDNNGNLVANNGYFKGTITSSTMSNSEIKGGSININDKFFVDNQGNMIAKNGTFSGDIVGGSINIGNNFIVDKNGNLTSTTVNNQNKEIYSKIEQTANSITSTVNKNYQDLDGKITTTNSTIEQTAKSITSTVNENYKDLNGRLVTAQSSIDQNARDITLKVSEDKVEGMISVGVDNGISKATIQANQINFIGAVFGQNATFRGIVQADGYRGSDGTPHIIDFGSYGRINGTGNGIRLARNGLNYINVTDGGRIDFYGGDPNNIMMSVNAGGGMSGYLTVKSNINVPTINGQKWESKRELKKNIEPMKNNALEKVMSTTVYKYHYKEDLDNELKYTGVIIDESPVDIINPDGRHVNIYSMLSVLWKAVQEQQGIISKLTES